MNEFTTYHFKQCIVRYFPAADYLETVFQDGAKCPAQFSFTLDDVAKAEQLGYPSTHQGVRTMNLEHELSHTFIAEALGEPYCPVLRSVAVKEPCEGAWEREALVLDFQRALNSLPLGEHLWEAMRYNRARSLAFEFIARFRK